MVMGSLCTQDPETPILLGPGLPHGLLGQGPLDSWPAQPLVPTPSVKGSLEPGVLSWRRPGGPGGDGGGLVFDRST